MENPSVLSVDESAISCDSVFSSCAMLSGSISVPVVTESVTPDASVPDAVAYTYDFWQMHKIIVITTTMQAKPKVSLQ
jgi:hypothetical protein